MTESDVDAGVDQLTDILIIQQLRIPNSNEENNIADLVDPDIDVNNTVTNTSGNGGTTASKPKYKGFNMVGKIEIPKIKETVSAIDPSAFIAIENVHEVDGKRYKKSH